MAKWSYLLYTLLPRPRETSRSPHPVSFVTEAVFVRHIGKKGMERAAAELSVSASVSVSLGDGSFRPNDDTASRIALS